MARWSKEWCSAWLVLVICGCTPWMVPTGWMRWVKLVRSLFSSVRVGLFVAVCMCVCVCIQRYSALNMAMQSKCTMEF